VISVFSGFFCDEGKIRLFLDQLEREIKHHHLIVPNEKILVGVSGGPDSIALLDGLRRLSHKEKWQVHVIHVNHQLRGKESDADAEYVADYCRKWAIPCHVERVDVNKALHSGGNKQAVARKLRYQAFAHTAMRWKIKKLILAHHADDQVETILMRLIRGTSVSGLSGMEKRRIWRGLEIIRPLLGLSKSLIEEYCLQENLQPRHDQSNDSLCYTRNRIRLQLIPQLKKYNNKVSEAILQLGEIVKEEEKVWQTLVQEAWDRVVISKEMDEIRVDCQSYVSLFVALQRRLVKLILNCLVNDGTNVEITLETIEQARTLALSSHPSGQIQLAKNIFVIREYDQLCFKRHEMNREDFPSLADERVPLTVPGVTALPQFGGEMEIFFTDRLSDEWRQSESIAVFDAEQLPLDQPLFVRSRKPGDRMRLFGMSGSKKLKKVLMEKKIPRHLRRFQPVVVLGEEIIWLPGIKRSNLAPISSETKRILCFLWHEDGNRST
jgi:tRNA(Ile)-lysidine synthase